MFRYRWIHLGATVQKRSIKTWTIRTKQLNRDTHRASINHRRYQQGVDAEEILAYHSRDDFNDINPRAGIRTYKDATTSMVRKNLLIPDLRPEDLEANQVYESELTRQRAIIARVEKIKIIVDDPPKKGLELNMKKNISTPYDCACHVHEIFSSRSVVAELVPLNAIDGKESSLYWDMNRPLDGDYRIKFRHFLDQESSFLNKIYWRSCSFVLGMAIRLAFKDSVTALLHSWPKPEVKSGSFIYDVAMNLSDKWTPSERELRAFTKVLWNIKSAKLPLERLEVDSDIAKQMFKSNPFKLSQIDSISGKQDGKVVVYRCGGLLDMSVGPMIANTDQIGRITLASVHCFEQKTEGTSGLFYRFQGVSLPQQLPMSSYLYQNILINRAKALNKQWL